jgi:uncharacterized protein
MSSFLIGVFDRWHKHGDRSIRIRELDAIAQRVAGAPANHCTLAGECFGRYYLVEPNGDVAHCDLFLGDPKYTLGNVLADTFSGFRDGAALRTLQGENARALESLRTCPEFGVCNGWCPHERYIGYRHDLLFDESCCGLGELIRHVRGCLERERAEAVVTA